MDKEERERFITCTLTRRSHITLVTSFLQSLTNCFMPGKKSGWLCSNPAVILERSRMLKI